jgi:hypothetical protein
MNKPCFERSDFADTVPPPGCYPSTISTARYRSSRNGNRMLVVVHALDGVGAPHDHVPDYFVIEGASARGVSTARRRLVRLYRACGLNPVAGEAIDPGVLCEARLVVRIEHEQYDGELRLKVVGYHAHDAQSEPVPF